MIITIIGARPQFIKAAALSREFQNCGLEEEIIHTGQHYDYKMSQIFFDELNLPGVNINLNIGSGSQGEQTAQMLQGIEKVLLARRQSIKFVLLYGDTNSTLAGALAAAKLNIPIIHIEAGLRSFNKSMPEEINRIVTDHLSSMFFCSSEEGKNQLNREGIKNNVYVVGDIMLDSFNIFSKIARKKYTLKDILPTSIIDNFYLLTIHRPSNTDNQDNFKKILAALDEEQIPIVWPVHPRNRLKLKKIDLPNNIHLFEPFSYLEMMVVLKKAKKVITDSGGLQKEAYWAKKPCITLREETEWVETLHNHWNMLTGPKKYNILDALKKEVNTSTWKALYGNGKASEQIVQRIKEQS